MEIYKYGSEILRTDTKKVENIDQKVIDLLEDMIETMILAPGIGLAAPQVGSDLSMFVMNVDDGVFERIINPVILETTGVSTFNEGCLSFPQIYFDIVRPEWIRVSYTNEKGEEVIREREGLWARCFQHELDHLKGKLMVDLVSKKQLRVNRSELDSIEHLGLAQNLGAIRS